MAHLARVTLALVEEASVSGSHHAVGLALY